MTKKEAAERFWDHALSVYGRDAVREALLRLQDQGGADVPMLLWCLWCHAEGRGLSSETMERAIAFSRAWQSAVVGPARAHRRALKLGVEGVPARLAGDARGRIAETEQALERMQMEHLASMDAGGLAEDAATLVARYQLIAGLELDAADVSVLLTST